MAGFFDLHVITHEKDDWPKWFNFQNQIELRTVYNRLLLKQGKVTCSPYDKDVGEQGRVGPKSLLGVNAVTPVCTRPLVLDEQTSNSSKCT